MAVSRDPDELWERLRPILKQASLRIASLDERSEAICEWIWQQIDEQNRHWVINQLVKRGVLWLKKSEIRAQARLNEWNDLHPRVRDALRAVGPQLSRGDCVKAFKMRRLEQYGWSYRF